MISDIADGVSRAAASLTNLVAKLAVAAMMLHIGFDLIVRAVLGSAPEGMPETVSRLYMVAVVFLPLAAAQLGGRQIEVSFFAERMPPLASRVQAVAVGLLTSAVAGLMSYLSFGIAVEATQRLESVTLLNGTLAIWPARWAIVLGFGSWAFVAALQALSAARSDPSAPNGPDASA